MVGATVVDRFDDGLLVTVDLGEGQTADYFVTATGVEVIDASAGTRWAFAAASAPELLAAARDAAEGHAPALDLAATYESALRRAMDAEGYVPRRDLTDDYEPDPDVAAYRRRLRAA